MTYRRPPAVSGAFYPGGARALSEAVASYLVSRDLPEVAKGAIVPHAGYIYSGATAGALYARLEVPERVVLLGPNHTGLGRAARGASLVPRGLFDTPVGEAPIDEELAAAIAGASDLVQEDLLAHEEEHSLEVQLPFLLARQPRLTIVPLVLNFDDYERCRQLGAAIAAAIARVGGEVLIVASSDMNHYEPRVVAARKDALVLERVKALDPEGLLRVTRAERISMCGRIPAATMLVTAIAGGAREAIVVGYTDSGATSGDTEAVVGYAGVLVR